MTALPSRRFAASLLAVCVGAVLAGCVATNYGALTDKRVYGYTERKREDGSYVVFVVYPSADLARQYWDKRASELCEGRPYDKNVFRADRPTVRYDHYGGMPGAFEIEGYLTCKGA